MADASDRNQETKSEQKTADDLATQIRKGGKEAAEELVKELKKGLTVAEPAGDPEVMVAFALGWQMSELYQPDTWDAQDAKHEPDQDGHGDLPGLSALGGRQRAELGIKQIGVGVKKLEKTIADADLTAPSTADATAALPQVQTDDAYLQAIFKLHVELLQTLTATHFKLGKAYGLGRALADTTRVPSGLETLEKQLEKHRIANLKNWLTDLTSLFPPHAARVVHDSLDGWRDWAEKLAAPAPAVEQSDDTGGEPTAAKPTEAAGSAGAAATPGAASPLADIRQTVSLLRRQGERWRSLLSGEKAAADALSSSDYVQASEMALTDTEQLLRKFREHFKGQLLGGAVVLVLLLVLIVVDPTKGSIAGGIAAILVGLGVTWKGVGATLGSSVAKLEHPIWQAALDTQIAKAISLRPDSDAAGTYVAPSGKQSDPSGQTDAGQDG